jgi:hypothetical protein
MLKRYFFFTYANVEIHRGGGGGRGGGKKNKR